MPKLKQYAILLYFSIRCAARWGRPWHYAPWPRSIPLPSRNHARRVSILPFQPLRLDSGPYPSPDSGDLCAKLLPPPLQQLHHRVPLRLVQRQPIDHMPPRDRQAVPRLYRIGIGDAQRQFVLQQHLAAGLHRAEHIALRAYAGAGLSAFQTDCLSAWHPVLLRIKSEWPKSNVPP